jgi:hypothetical protein
MKISKYVFAAAHSLAWHAYEVADQRYVVAHQTYRDILDFKAFMQAKRKRVQARQIYRTTEYLMYYMNPVDQLTYMTSYYRGMSLFLQSDRLYQNGMSKPV